MRETPTKRDGCLPWKMALTNESIGNDTIHGELPDQKPLRPAAHSTLERNRYVKLDTGVFASRFTGSLARLHRSRRNGIVVRQSLGRDPCGPVGGGLDLRTQSHHVSTTSTKDIKMKTQHFFTLATALSLGSTSILLLAAP